MGKKNVHKLSTDPVLSVSLFGISSHENDYRISWALNEQLGFRLHKDENHTFFHSKFNETLTFSQYSFVDEDNSLSYRLISNRCDNGFLLEEYKNIDFLLLTDLMDNVQLQQLQSEMKRISFIGAVFPIDLGVLKNKSRLF